MRQQTQGDRVVVVQGVEAQRRRPWRLKAALALGAVASVAMVAGELADRVPGIPNIGPRVERETKEGMSTVIAMELAKLKEFRGAEKTYSVTAELTKRETQCLIACKTKQDQAFISTKGYAEGVIDLSGVKEEDIGVSEDNKVVTIKVPHAKPTNIRASHAPEDVKIIHDTNRWCDASLSCETVPETDLLQLADRKVANTVNGDKEILDTTELQAESFIETIVNGVGRQLLKNQHPDPNFEPERIDVRLEFYTPAPQTVTPQQLG